MQRNGHVKGQQLAAVGARHLDAEVCVAPPRCRDGGLQQGIGMCSIAMMIIVSAAQEIGRCLQQSQKTLASAACTCTAGQPIAHR